MTLIRKLLGVGVLVNLLVLAVLCHPLAFAQQTEIHLWTFIDPAGKGPRQDALRYLIQTFEAKNPGVKVVAEVQAWNQIGPSLLRASAAQRVPDVVMIFSPYMTTQTDANTLMPLTPYISKWGRDRQADLVVPLSETSVKNEVYGLFYELRVSSMIYRADLLEKLQRPVPRTLEELTEVAVAAKQPDLVGLGLNFNPKDSFGKVVEWFLPVLGGVNAKILNDDGTAAFNNKQFERLVQWIQDSVQKTGITPRDIALMGDEETERVFNAGRMLFKPQMTHRIAAIRSASGLGKAVQVMPLVAFDGTRPAPTLAEGWMLSIPRGAKQPDVAWRFIDYWVSPEIQAYQAKTAGYLPAVKSATKDQWFKSEEAADLRWAMDYAAKYPFKFRFPKDTDLLYNTLCQMFEQIVTNRLSVSQGLEWAVQQYNTGRR
jgi:multiple sugar transport system substrate-binding protein